MNFEYYAPTRVVFGVDAELQTAQLIRRAGGTRVLIVYGGGSAVRSSLIGRIEAALKEQELPFTLLGGVVPNPHLDKVYEGIALGKQLRADFILAVGGGSVIDTAKAIAYGCADDRDVWELFTHRAQAERCLPVGVVLTIAAAGSEMSSGCVITNEKTGEKRAYDDDLCRPAFAVMDPALTLTLPEYQTSSGIADILMHMMERYFNQSENMAVTDAVSEALMRTVMRYARVLMHDPQDLKARAEIMWAGSLAHNGLTGCATGGGDCAFAALTVLVSGWLEPGMGEAAAIVPVVVTLALVILAEPLLPSVFNSAAFLYYTAALIVPQEAAANCGWNILWAELGVLVVIGGCQFVVRLCTPKEAHG